MSLLNAVAPEQIILFPPSSGFTCTTIVQRFGSWRKSLVCRKRASESATCHQQPAACNRVDGLDLVAAPPCCVQPWFPGARAL